MYRLWDKLRCQSKKPCIVHICASWVPPGFNIELNVFNGTVNTLHPTWDGWRVYSLVYTFPLNGLIIHSVNGAERYWMRGALWVCVWEGPRGNIQVLEGGHYLYSLPYWLCTIDLPSSHCRHPVNTPLTDWDTVWSTSTVSHVLYFPPWLDRDQPYYPTPSPYVLTPTHPEVGVVYSWGHMPI